MPKKYIDQIVSIREPPTEQEDYPKFYPLNYHLTVYFAKGPTRGIPQKEVYYFLTEQDMIDFCERNRLKPEDVTDPKRYYLAKRKTWKRLK